MKTWEESKEQDIDVFTEKEKDEMKLEVEIVSAIIKRRNELGLTQRELAKLAEMKQPVLARIEGLNSIPSIKSLSAILNALNLEIKIVEKEK